ncbi:MAG: hypothetical protein KC502_05700 [Myxococcales bacterium]|nr:hypothetical protein [Myxococcales bacterium]
MNQLQSHETVAIRGVIEGPGMQPTGKIALLFALTWVVAGCGNDPATPNNTTTGADTSGGTVGGGIGHVPRTTLSAATTPAGVKINVTCTWSDTGGPMTLGSVKVPNEANATSVDLSGGRFDLTATKAGGWPVACESNGEADPNPPTLTVTAGAAVGTTATLAKSTVVSGKSTAVTCSRVDAHGNALEGGEFKVTVTPADIATVDKLTLTGAKLGPADIRCLTEGVGADKATPAKLDVIAGEITKVVAIAPKTGTVVGNAAAIVCEAQDAEGNPIAVSADKLGLVVEAPLKLASTGGLEVLTTKAGKWPVKCRLKSPALTSEPTDVAFIAGPATQITVALSPVSVVAGSPGSDATCGFLDDFGNPTKAPTDATTSVDGGADWQAIEGKVSSEKAGKHQITCTAKGGTFKKVPAELTVVPAEPSFTKGTATPTAPKAGDTLTVGCNLFDKYGNEVLEPPTDWSVKAPTGCKSTNKATSGATVVCTKAGTHSLTCETKAVTDFVPIKVTVVPNAPVSFKLKLDPEQPNYTTGQKIGLSADAKDKYGNVIEGLVLAPITMTPKGGLIDAVNAQISCEQDGLYTVTATLKAFPKLKASRKILSDSSGPLINISTPKRGSTRIHTSTVTVKFSTADELSPLGAVTFNDKAIKAGDGIGISAVMSVKQGLNIIKVVAKDKWGNTSTHSQSFYSAKKYHKTQTKDGTKALISNGVEAWLGQKVLDSGKRNHKAPKDIATVIEVILKNFDTKALLATTFPVSWSVFKFIVKIKSVKFGNSKINGGHPKLKLTALNGAMALSGSIYSMKADVFAEGQNWGSPDLKIEVTASSMSVSAKLYISVQSTGKVVVNTKNVSVKLNNLDVKIKNGWGFLVNWLIDLFSKTITKKLQETMESQIASKINGPLAAMLQAFALDTTFNVPGFFGALPTPLKMATQLSSLSFKGPTSGKKGGAHIKLKTGMTSVKKVGHVIHGSLARRSCLKTYQTAATMSRVQPMEVALHYDTANQLLASMWQSGGMLLAIDPTALASIDLKGYGLTELKVKTDFLLPPLLSDCVPGGKPELQMGDIRLDITAKMGGKPLVVRAYISASAKVDVEPVKAKNGQEISLTVGKIGTLESDIDSVMLAGVATGQGTVGFFEKLLPAVTGLLVGQLQGTLASIPLPELDLSIMTTTIPKGTKLAIDVKDVDGSKGHIYIRGGVK